MRGADLEDGSLLTALLRRHYSANDARREVYNAIDRWLLEVDVAGGSPPSGIVRREIAVGSDGVPLVCAPTPGGLEMWCGARFTVEVSDRAEISKAEFERQWNVALHAPPLREPVVVKAENVNEAESLYGLWSTAIPGDLGAMSDEAIAFFPNGTGFFECANVGLMLYETFTWSFDSSISFDTSILHSQQGGHVISEPGRLVEIKRREIRIERAPGCCDVIELDLSEAGYDWVDARFGRSGLSQESIRWPSF